MRFPVILIVTGILLGGSAACEMVLGQSSSNVKVASTPKTPVPSKKQLDAALKSLKAESGVDVSDIKTAEAPNAAGSLLSNVTGETEPLKRYAILSSAMNLASKAGEISLAYRAIDLLGEEFAVDGLMLKSDVLARRAKLRQPPANFYDLTVLSVQIALEAREAYRFDVALEVLDDGIGDSKKFPEIAITPQLMAIKDELKHSTEEFSKVATARAHRKQTGRLRKQP